ncbi:uncharacterized protein LOC114542680 [Dendronephthya gigantea]|uniref:uncharacterized protein LOC114542680 n=1 Tax=Dendronephthya gigantea TaxID=151771 RepID=UPI00106CCAAE|nr:uncharacterized protein LOC114542680 [Dendronephthya gigantea]
MAQYYTRIRETAKKCEFANEDEAVRDHLIKTMTNNRLRAKTIRNNWTLTQILDEAAIDEESTSQANEIQKKLKSETEYKRVNQIIKKETRQSFEICQRCGSKHERRQCKAYGAECYKCGKRNHFARMCKSIQSKRQEENQETRGRGEKQDVKNGRKYNQETRRNRSKSKGRFSRKRIRHVEVNKDDEETSNSDDDSTDEDIERIVKHLNIHRTAKERGEKNECAITINGMKMIVEPDTGADANVMDEYQFKSLLQQTPEETELRKTKMKLKTLTEELPVMGECSVTMENETRKAEATIAVIKGKIDSYPLLGRKTLEDLGMVKFDATGRLKEPNRDLKSINRINHENKELVEIIGQHEERFKGIGQVKRDGEVVVINLPMKENVEPVAQKPRRVPYHLVEPLRKRIDEFVEYGIMEKVPECESISWCSPLVVQPKPNNPSDIRVSLDLRVLNKSMERTQQVQAPITEDFITTFKDCTIFSKLDMNHGYHQFTLDEQSRKLMTFSTPWGNYRYQRLAFGGINSQDLFDAEMSKIISGIPRVLNNRDDIMVGGIDWEDHNKNLATLLQRLELHNITLRKEKCEFGRSEIEFHGHLFTKDGLKPSPNKVEAVQECSPPKSKEEVVSFVQMLAYLSRYISNFSRRCEPLRRITKDNQKFFGRKSNKKPLKI